MASTKEHMQLRDRVHTYYIGHLSAAPIDVSPAVVEVQKKTGIQPPAWFNTEGVTISQVNATAIAQHAGRSS